MGSRGLGKQRLGIGLDDIVTCSPNGSHVAERLLETLVASGTDRSHEVGRSCSLFQAYPLACLPLLSTQPSNA